MSDFPGLSVRCRNALRNEGVMSLHEAAKLPAVQLLRLPNFGRKSLRELGEAVQKLGICLPPDWERHVAQVVSERNDKPTSLNMRFGPELRALIEASAKRNCRSIGAEMEFRVRQTLERDELMRAYPATDG